MTKKSSSNVLPKRITRSSSGGSIEDHETLNTARSKRSACRRICKQMNQLSVKPSCDLIQEKVELMRESVEATPTVKLIPSAPKILKDSDNELTEYISINPALLEDESLWDHKALKSLCCQLKLLTSEELEGASRNILLEALKNFNVAPLDGGDQLFSKLLNIKIDAQPTKPAKPSRRVSILKTSVIQMTPPKPAIRRRSISFHPYNEVRVFNRESFPIAEESPSIEPSPGLLSNLYSFISSLKVLGVV